MKETTKPRCQCDGCLHCSDEYGQVDYKKLNLRELIQDAETQEETHGSDIKTLALKAHALRDLVGLNPIDSVFMGEVETLERYWKLDIFEIAMVVELERASDEGE